MITVRPSCLQELASCPCYERSKSMDEDKTEFGETMAERGTRLHTAVQNEDLTLCKTAEEIDMAQFAIDYTHNVRGGYPEDAVVYKELDVDIPEINRNGRIDWCVVGKDEAFVIDYKFIMTTSVAAPEGNWQLRGYVAGLFQRFPELVQAKATIVAPAIHYTPKAVMFTREDYASLAAGIAGIKAQVDDPFKKPVTCEYCGHCMHAARCPALGKIAIALGTQMGLALPDKLQPGMLMTPRERGLAQMCANALEAWCEEVKKANTEAAKRGEQVLGHNLVHRKSGLSLAVDANVVIEALQAAPDGIRMPLQDILVAVSLAPGSLVPVMKGIHGGTEKETKEKLETWLISKGFAKRAPMIQYLSRVRGSDLDQLLALPAVKGKEETTGKEVPTGTNETK